jgi:hypothetical protein
MSHERPARRAGAPRRGRVATVLAGTAVVAAALAAAVGTDAPRAGAATCTSPVRYASSSNTIYLSSGTWDLPQLRQLCPAAPLAADPAAPGTWDLRANLVVSDGATLRVRGTAAGGTVNTLRLLSRASGDPREVVELTANYGTIELASVAVTSWDDVTRAPDTDVTIPAGVEKAKGRAFVRAISVLVDGVPRESRLDVADSDLGYLGYYAGEAYGVSYKARGCGSGTEGQRVCDLLDVSGSQRRSRFHDNMMGTYTWGASDMAFEGNTYEHNVMYGLDPHDDSDHLTITGNVARDNGRHGIICSQRCDHLTITGNDVHHNGIPPYTVNPADDDPQVHGIMLHRGVTDSVVAGNDVHDHPNGAGIAVMDSSGDVVRDNRLARNKYGLRTSVGSHAIRWERNDVQDSGSYAVYAYPGTSDDPVYAATPRPGDDEFVDTTIGASGSYAVRLLSTDGFRFTGTRVGAGAGAVRIDDTRGFVWENGALPPGGIVLRTGAERGSDAVVRTPVGAVKADLDIGARLAVEAPDGRLSLLSPAVESHVVTPAGATLTLGSPSGTVKRTVTPTAMSMRPVAGQVTARLGTWGSSGGHVLFSGAAPGTPIAFRLAGLTPGRAYAVRVDAAPATTLVAGPGGTIEWGWTEATGGGHDLSISALP